MCDDGRGSGRRLVVEIWPAGRVVRECAGVRCDLIRDEAVRIAVYGRGVWRESALKKSARFREKRTRERLLTSRSNGGHLRWVNWIGVASKAHC